MSRKDRRRSPVPVGAVVLWVVLAAGIGLLIGSVNLPRYWAVSRHGAATEARVTSVQPQNHNSFSYSYDAESIPCDGWGQIGEDGTPANPKVGDTITIHYAADQPCYSVAGDLAPQMNNEITSVALAALVAPTFLTFGIVASLRRLRGW